MGRLTASRDDQFRFPRSADLVGGYRERQVTAKCAKGGIYSQDIYEKIIRVKSDLFSYPERPVKSVF